MTEAVTCSVLGRVTGVDEFRDAASWCQGLAGREDVWVLELGQRNVWRLVKTQAFLFSLLPPVFPSTVSSLVRPCRNPNENI